LPIASPWPKPQARLAQTRVYLGENLLHPNNIFIFYIYKYILRLCLTQRTSIRAADVCFIRPIALQHFATRFEDVKNSPLSFLYSLKEYVQYYTDLEVKSSPAQRKYTTPYTIPNLGALRPLDKRHALNSYWRWIRFIIKNEKSALSNPPEILLLLPLKIDLGLITIKSDGFTFPAKIFGYIFPFGSCCINMNVKMRNINLSCDEFNELYPKFSCNR
jgi:hypothetical protein